MPLLHRPTTRTNFADRTFRCCAPSVWNSLDSETLHCSSFSGFKRRLKTLLFHQTFSRTTWTVRQRLWSHTTCWRYLNRIIIIIIIIIVSIGNCKLGHDCRRVCSHRRRNATRQFRRVGVGGVYWTLVLCLVYCLSNAPWWCCEFFGTKLLVFFSSVCWLMCCPNCFRIFCVLLYF